MRCVYVYATAKTSNPGSVQKKITAQINAALSNGDEIRGIFFTLDNTENKYFEGIEFYQVAEVGPGYFRGIRQTAETYRTIGKVLQEKLQSDEKIFIRYWGVGRQMLQFAKAFRGRIVWNHLNNESAEIKLYRAENPSFVGHCFSLAENKWFPLLAEFFWGKRIRRHSGKAIVNSKDIAAYQKKRAGNKYVCCVVPDGVNTAEFPIRILNKKEQEIRLVFLKGASGDAEYNGLDRLIRGMRNYKGDYKITLTIIGADLNFEKELVNFLDANGVVNFTGELSKEELDKALNNFELGVGALGKHRKKLFSTSTIKSREYFARGIPFIFAHHDPDFSDNPEAMKYCLQFPGDETAIDCKQFSEFLMQLDNIPDYGAKMHQFALENLDYKVKMRQTLDFIFAKNGY